jgi:hypothetical protein
VVDPVQNYDSFAPRVHHEDVVPPPEIVEQVGPKIQIRGNEILDYSQAHHYPEANCTIQNNTVSTLDSSEGLKKVSRVEALLKRSSYDFKKQDYHHQQHHP